MKSDKEVLKSLSELIRSVKKTDSDYQRITDTLYQIEDINEYYFEENILKILCQGYCVSVKFDENGKYYHEPNEIELHYRKEWIQYCLNRGFDLQQKSGRYNAPILFYVRDLNLFEFLCSQGADPNERLTLAGFEGTPYFCLHHDFRMDIFEIAIKYGFNISQKTKDNTEIVHLIFQGFIEFDPPIFEKLAKVFSESINLPNAQGLTCLQLYVLASDVSLHSLANFERMIEVGFDKDYKTQKDIQTSNCHIPKNSTAFDILLMKCATNSFDKHLVLKTKSILRPNYNKIKKKWWHF